MTIRWIGKNVPYTQYYKWLTSATHVSMLQHQSVFQKPYSILIYSALYIYVYGTGQKMMKKKDAPEKNKFILYCESFNIWLREISTENILLRMYIVGKSLQILNHCRIGTEQIQIEMSSANSFAHNNQSKLIESILI